MAGKKPNISIDCDSPLMEILANSPSVSASGTVYAGSFSIHAKGAKTKTGRTVDVDPEQIVMGEKIGQGGSGCVKKGRNIITNGELALKEIKISSENRLKEIQSELRLFLGNDGENASEHPNICDIYGAYTHEGCVYIIMELLEGSLAQVGKVPLAILAKMTKMVLKGLHFIHKRRHLIHRDIKPHNLLFASSGTIKITDFGVSSQLENANSFVGTVTYMSPERLQGQSHGAGGDIWSLGISLVELATGVHPYRNAIDQESDQAEAKFWAVLNYLKNNTETVDLSDVTFSDDCRDFILKCCNRDSKQRPSSEQLLQHPFIEKNCLADEAKDQAEVQNWLSKGMTKCSPITAFRQDSQVEIDNALNDLIDLGASQK